MQSVIWTRLTIISTDTVCFCYALSVSDSYIHKYWHSVFQVRDSCLLLLSHLFSLFANNSTCTHTLICHENTLMHTHIHTHSHRTHSLCSFHWNLCLPCPLIKAICSPGPLHEKSVLFVALFPV